MEYNLEMEKAIEVVRESGAKKVLVQLPDGLKPQAKEIVDQIQEKTDVKVVVWAGSCFGACDVPNVDEDEFDLVIQWGHSAWKK